MESAPYERFGFGCTQFSFETKCYFFRSLIKTVLIDSADPPSLYANHPSDNTVFEGENLTLQCQVTDANPQPNITWYRVSRSNTALSHGVNLTFINVSRYDDGKYYCVVENGVGKIISRTSSVNVLCKL